MSFLLFALVGAVQAISANGGNRLLVILEDIADKDGYTKFLGDLEGMRPANFLSRCFAVSFPCRNRYL